MGKKGIRITYWITTVLFVLFMLFGGITELMRTESSDAVLVYLGYPLYLNYILGVAKVLGSIALIQTKWKTIKEWAYAGFSIDIIGASLSFALIGEGFAMQVIPLLTLIVMFTSYSCWKKLH